MDSNIAELHIKAGIKCGIEYTCGKKINYKSEESAIKSADSLNKKINRPNYHELEAYPCAFCGGWHIGRKMTMEELIELSKDHMNLDIIKDIPRYKDWVDITVPMYGWSQNFKYRLKDICGNDFILRVSDITLFDDKKREYDNITRLSQYDVLMPKPIEFGICNGGKNVYMLLTWIDGVAVQDVIRKLEDNLQYQLGYSSGSLLRKIHAYSTVKPKVSWGNVYGENIEKMINEYRKVNISIHHEQEIISYIYANKHLLDSRSQVIRHGDFHVGNLIITPDNEIGVIDFDKCAIGDGWEEFGGIVWAARLSEKFAKGQIDGYFSGEVPDVFFRLLALYIGLYALEHVVRSAMHHLDKMSIESIYSNTDFMTSMFNNFNTYIPNWYR